MAIRAQHDVRLRSSELVGFLEAVYRLDLDEQTWLAEVMEACRRVWAREGWAHGAIYDASDVSVFRTTTQHVIDAPDGAIALLGRGMQLFSPSLVARSFRILMASLTREIARPELEEVYTAMTALGYTDTLGVNGVDPSGHGVFIGLWGWDHAMSAAELQIYRCMAHHLAAAYRYRRRLGEPAADGAPLDPTADAEAVLDPRGRVLHATGPATEKRLQAALVETSHARDLARTRRGDHDEALRRWSPLTSARWTLVDSYERSGHRYVVARENQTPIAGLAMLSDRERQVVAYLAIGQSTKETAYALGIADATVRVLVGRAVAKLGVKNRRGLLDHPEVRPLIP